MVQINCTMCGSFASFIKVRRAPLESSGPIPDLDCILPLWSLSPSLVRSLSSLMLSHHLSLGLLSTHIPASRCLARCSELSPPSESTSCSAPQRPAFLTLLPTPPQSGPSVLAFWTVTVPKAGSLGRTAAAAVQTNTQQSPTGRK